MRFKAEHPYQKIGPITRMPILDQNDYIVVVEKDGNKRVETGPKVVQPIFGEQYSEIKEAINVNINEYIVLLDKANNANPLRHIRGPAKVYPTPYEEIVRDEHNQAVRKCVEVNEATAIWLRQADGNVILIEQPQFYMPKSTTIHATAVVHSRRSQQQFRFSHCWRLAAAVVSGSASAWSATSPRRCSRSQSSPSSSRRLDRICCVAATIPHSDHSSSRPSSDFSSSRWVRCSSTRSTCCPTSSRCSSSFEPGQIAAPMRACGLADSSIQLSVLAPLAHSRRFLLPAVSVFAAGQRQRAGEGRHAHFLSDLRSGDLQQEAHRLPYADQLLGAKRTARCIRAAELSDSNQQRHMRAMQQHLG